MGYHLWQASVLEDNYTHPSTVVNSINLSFPRILIFIMGIQEWNTPWTFTCGTKGQGMKFTLQ